MDKAESIIKLLVSNYFQIFNKSNEIKEDRRDLKALKYKVMICGEAKNSNLFEDYKKTFLSANKVKKVTMPFQMNETKFRSQCCRMIENIEIEIQFL